VSGSVDHRGRPVWLIQAQMLQYFLNNIWIFNRSVRRLDDDSNWPTTLFTFLNIDGEHTLEPLRPQKNSGSSNKPSVSGSLVLLQIFEEQRVRAVYCWVRKLHENA
jgi:hypothetical protein